ncbi:MAG: hypothetical protein ACJ8BW_13750 [Ktedonobacteraceae bacterium]|jgi:hypothetical protein
MRENNIETSGLDSLPEQYQARLQRASQTTGDSPEKVMDESLKLYEWKCGLTTLDDPVLFKRGRAQDQSRIATCVNSNMTPEQRHSRAKLGGYGKAAHRLGIPVEEYIKGKARRGG